jgi:hypothetical protein
MQTAHGYYIASKGKDQLYLTKDSGDAGTHWLQTHDSKSGHYGFINHQDRIMGCTRDGTFYLTSSWNPEVGFAFVDAGSGKWALYNHCHQRYIKPYSDGTFDAVKKQDHECGLTMGNHGPSKQKIGKKMKQITGTEVSFLTCHGKYIASAGKQAMYLTTDAKDKNTKWLQHHSKKTGHYQFVNASDRWLGCTQDGVLYRGKDKSGETGYAFVDAGNGKWALYNHAQQRYIKSYSDGTFDCIKKQDSESALTMGNHGTCTRNVKTKKILD